MTTLPVHFTCFARVLAAEIAGQLKGEDDGRVDDFLAGIVDRLIQRYTT